MVDDEGALQLYLNHRAALVNYAVPIVGCPARAEDVVQEAYLRYAPAEDVRNPVAFLYRVVRNLSLDLRRSLVPDHRRADGAGLSDELPAPDASPEQQALQYDELRAVAQALAALPERTRLAFELYRFEGLNLRQIAERLGVSISYVHQMIHIAMTRCAEQIADEDIDE